MQQLQLEEWQAKSAPLAQETERAGKDAPSFLLEKNPSESFVELSLPFGTDKMLREEYINFHGQLRYS